MSEDLSRRGVVSEVWSIAWPTVLTMTSFTLMQFTDKLMVGQVGPREIAAQGSGGIWAFVPMAFVMGLLTVVNTWSSQHCGARRDDKVAAYGWSAVWISVASWAVVMLPMAMLLGPIFEWIHANEHPELVEMEIAYGRILLLGGVFSVGARGIHQFFFGILRPRVVTVAAIAGNGINVVLSYILIFGEAGLPALSLPGVPGVTALGVHGAAVGTVVGVIVEFAIPMAIFLGPRLNARFATRANWRPQLGPIKDVLRLGWPGSALWGNEIVCWAIFMTVYVGWFGESSLAAGWIVLGWMQLSFMPANGFGVAATSLMGIWLGAGKADAAAVRGRVCIWMAVLYMTICGVAFFLFREPMVRLFLASDLDAEQAQTILDVGMAFLVIAAVFQPFDALGMTAVGALRGAGDVVWPGVAMIALAWLILIAGGAVVGIGWPTAGPMGPWAAAAAYLIVLGLAMVLRFERGRWRSIDLVRQN